MKRRYTVRKDHSRWIVFDNFENKQTRSYPNVAKSSAQSLCKYLNNQAQKGMSI